MSRILKSLIILLFLGLFVLAACNLPAAEETPTQQVANMVGTAAAQTVAVQLTQAASGKVNTPVPPTQPAPTQQQVQPTNTKPAPTPVPPTSVPPTPVPPTPIPVPCNRADYVKDVNYPDDTEVAPNATFNKTWRLKNIGSCTWTSGYVLIFDTGDAMGAPATVQLTNGTIPPGAEVDVTVPNMKAPDTPGTYQAFWKLRDGSGSVFGLGTANKAFWVKIKVSASINYDFTSKAPDAEWRNGSGVIPYGDPAEDSAGVPVVVQNFKLSNGKTYDKVLVMYPQKIDNGVVYGIFTSYKVQDGDHFKSSLGFRKDCGSGKVKFSLSYKDGSTVTLLKEWVKSCDTALLDVDVDLSGLKDKNVQFILQVSSEGAWQDDFAAWLSPRIQK